MTQRNRALGSQSFSQIRKQSSSSGTQEDNEDFTFTQPSTSQVQRGLEKLTPAQVDQKTSEVIQYFLVKDQKKIPVRRAGNQHTVWNDEIVGFPTYEEIFQTLLVQTRWSLNGLMVIDSLPVHVFSDLVKHVVKEYRNIYPEIIQRAARTFEQVFGLKLVEIDPKNHTYILINNLEAADKPSPIKCPANPKLGLLFVILGVTFMKGGVVRENVIWNTLKKLRVDSGEKHEEFGDVKRLVTEEFVRQKYLEYVRIPHTEPMEHEFRWGQRADMEVSKAKILEFMGQLHEQDPQSWTQQYREAHASSSSSNSSRSQR